ncbi:MAG: hypothetical protein JWO61_125 [Candidatus Saccharibacteria bacterium]|nr:hypothetical protein [Candidatus Saccharibacteria bacterium]
MNQDKSDYTAQTAKFLKQLKHIILAVVDENNAPWAVPVGVRTLEGLVVEWDSHMRSRHSLAIDHNPHIAMTAFVSKGSEWEEMGVYMEAEVESAEVIHDEFARYKARITAIWYNDAEHVKRSIDLEDLSHQLT